MKKIIISAVCFVVASALVFTGAFYIIWENNRICFEDTNGADCTLQTITDENIIKMDVGCRGIKEHYAIIKPPYPYDFEDFNGVAEIFTKECNGESFVFSYYYSEVKKGNFSAVIVVDGEIVHRFSNNLPTQKYKAENLSGTFSLRVAGESAEGTFSYKIS